MTIVVNTSSPLTIRELSGEQRTLRLVDRALPYRPVGFKGKQRVELTWYPGFAEATATVLGAAEEPTTMSGWWKDKFIANPVAVGVQSAIGVRQGQTFMVTLDGTQVNTAMETVKVVDSIMRQGQQLEVSWDEITRVGFLVSFEQRWHNTHDVEWEMEFEWTGRGEPIGASVFIQETSVGDTASSLGSAAQEVQSVSEPTFPISGPFSDELTSTLFAFTQNVQAAQNAAAQLAQLALSPTEAARRMAASCTGIFDAAQELAFFVESTPLTLINVTARPTFADMLASAVYGKVLEATARDARRQAAIRRATVTTMITSEIIGEYMARQGDDLRDVSRIYYGTPFEWRRLMIYNSLDSSTLLTGQVVRIPKIDAGDRRS